MAAWERPLLGAISKGRKAIQHVPVLQKLSKHLGNVVLGRIDRWERLKLLTHPYVQIERGFVLIHITRTAGTSLSRALDLNAPLTSNLHTRARDIMPLAREIDPNVKCVAFVRNPYARFVSLYDFARLEESLYCSSRNPERAPCGKHPDYDLLLDKDLEACAELLVAGKLSRPGWDPQTDWLTDKDGPGGELMTDFLGHVESLEADVQRLQKEYGIEIQALPWLNQSRTEAEKPPEWTDRARDLVWQFYRRDFDLLGYDK
jgi:hypothetical protein